MAWVHPSARRVAFGAGAFALTDLITGMAAYCVIILGTLCFVSWSWIRFAAEAASRGVAFGSTGQLEWAWMGAIATLPAIPTVIYLALQAYRIPVGLAREARHPGTGNLPGSWVPFR